MRAAPSQGPFEAADHSADVAGSAGQNSASYKDAGDAVVKPYAFGQSTPQLERNRFRLKRPKEACAAQHPHPLSVGRSGRAILTKA